MEGNFNITTCNHISNNSVLPTLLQQFGEEPFLFQQDNAAIHQARSIKQSFVLTSTPTPSAWIWAPNVSQTLSAEHQCCCCWANPCRRVPKSCGKALPEERRLFQQHINVYSVFRCSVISTSLGVRILLATQCTFMAATICSNQTKHSSAGT